MGEEPRRCRSWQRRLVQQNDMDLRRKNILLAVLIGLFALGLYVYAIAHVMSDTGLPT